MSNPAVREARRLYPACAPPPILARLDGIAQTVRGALLALDNRDTYTARLMLQCACDTLLAVAERLRSEGAS